MKKIGPCKSLKKFSSNAYEMEMPTWIGISPIFNVANIYPFVTNDTRDTTEGKDLNEEELHWIKKMPIA